MTLVEECRAQAQNAYWPRQQALWNRAADEIERLQTAVRMVWGRLNDPGAQLALWDGSSAEAKYVKTFLAENIGKIGVFLTCDELRQLRDAAKEQADDAG